MKVSTYIFVHDQNIILHNDKTGKFNNLPDKKYVFLGKKEIDKINNRDDVIIARNLKHNIEQYPKFCSFTGWYALWKNNLIQSDYIHLLEYDILINDNFIQETEKLISEQYDFIGYIPLPVTFAFISMPEYLATIIPAIKKHYNIDIKELVVSQYTKNNNSLWSSTTNSTFYSVTFYQYMMWFEKLIDDLKNEPMSGHAHERSISFFCLIFNNRVFFTQKLIKHLMLNSHSPVLKRTHKRR